MEIAHGINRKLGICDIECFKELFDVGCYFPEEDRWVEFEISHWKNEMFEFVRWYNSKPCDYLVTFNGVNYDQQVLQWVVNNHQRWFDLTNLEICERISRYSGSVIDRSKYNIPYDYREKQFSIPALDVFKIHHFDNEAKRTSLKWCEFMMNMEVEEMPVHFMKKGLTQEEIVEVRKYRRHDVRATEGVLYITLGQVDKVMTINGGIPVEELKAEYQGRNKIQDRFDVWKETGLECLNWSDVKIGEEWNKLDYMIAEGIKDQSLLFPKKVKSTYGQKFKNFFPKTMSFTTKHLQDFVERVGEQKIRRTKKGENPQEYPVTINGTTYTFAKGGIHSTEKNRRIIPAPGFLLRDADVGSQYPNTIVKLEIFPVHLKITILSQYQGKIKKRIEYKKIATQLKKDGKEDEARPYMSIQEMLKLCLNGGYFGKLGQPGSFLQYQEGSLRCTVGNEIEILMAVEMMEEAGLHVVSANTDGFVTMFPADKEDVYKDVCARWEEKVGNTVMGKLEYTDFACLWQKGVNNYIAKKTDGKVKKKGDDFLTDYQLNKNKSERVINLALEEYFINGKDPVEFIKNHKNIFDFCIGVRASGQMYYEEQWEDTDGTVHTKTHKKLVVYYISKKGNVLWKRGINNEGDPVNNLCNAPDKKYPLGQPKMTYFNKIFKSDDYGIDYAYYTMKTLKIIDDIEKSKKAAAYYKTQLPQKQTSLF